MKHGRKLQKLSHQTLDKTHGLTGNCGSRDVYSRLKNKSGGKTIDTVSVKKKKMNLFILQSLAWVLTWYG